MVWPITWPTYDQGASLRMRPTLNDPYHIEFQRFARRSWLAYCWPRSPLSVNWLHLTNIKFYYDTNILL